MCFIVEYLQSIVTQKSIAQIRAEKNNGNNNKNNDNQSYELDDILQIDGKQLLLNGFFNDICRQKNICFNHFFCGGFSDDIVQICKKYYIYDHSLYLSFNQEITNIITHKEFYSVPYLIKDILFRNIVYIECLTPNDNDKNKLYEITHGLQLIHLPKNKNYRNATIDYNSKSRQCNIRWKNITTMSPGDIAVTPSSIVDFKNIKNRKHEYIQFQCDVKVLLIDGILIR